MTAQYCGTHEPIKAALLVRGYFIATRLYCAYVVEPIISTCLCTKLNDNEPSQYHTLQGTDTGVYEAQHLQTEVCDMVSGKVDRCVTSQNCSRAGKNPYTAIVAI